MPLLPWFIGSDWCDAAPRLFILGKGHRDDLPTRVLPSNLQDGRETGLALQRGSIPHAAAWPYWKVIRRFLDEVHGDVETGIGRIARSNLVKCATATRGTGSTDRAGRAMIRRCVVKLGAVREELRILEPHRLLLVTGDRYDDFLSELAFEPGMRFEWLDDARHRVRCGRSQLLASRFIPESPTRRIEGLRLGHPERKKQDDYLATLFHWWRNPGDPPQGQIIP